MPEKIIIGVTGGISAYRIPDLAGALIKNGHEVRVVMTQNAKRFITPLTLATLSKNPVLDDDSEWLPDGRIKHIELAKWASMLVVAPATANTINKMANGITDNLLTSIYMALPKETKIVVCPAMNTKMWENPVTQDSLRRISINPRLYIVIPEEGLLACGDYGMGKLPSVRKIVEEIEGQRIFHEK